MEEEDADEHAQHFFCQLEGELMRQDELQMEKLYILKYIQLILQRQLSFHFVNYLLNHKTHKSIVGLIVISVAEKNQIRHFNLSF